MCADHRTRVDELLADYRRSRDQLEQVQHELSEMSETARDERESIAVTVGSDGVPCDVRLSREINRHYAPDDLAAEIVRLSRLAADRIAERSEAALAPLLPSDVDPSAMRQGRADWETSNTPRNDRGVADDVRTESSRQEPEEGDMAPGSWLRDGDPTDRRR